MVCPVEDIACWESRTMMKKTLVHCCWNLLQFRKRNFITSLVHNFPFNPRSANRTNAIIFTHFKFRFHCEEFISFCNSLCCSCFVWFAASTFVWFSCLYFVAFLLAQSFFAVPNMVIELFICSKHGCNEYIAFKSWQKVFIEKITKWLKKRDFNRCNFFFVFTGVVSFRFF